MDECGAKEYGDEASSPSPSTSQILPDFDCNGLPKPVEETWSNTDRILQKNVVLWRYKQPWECLSHGVNWFVPCQSLENVEILKCTVVWFHRYLSKTNKLMKFSFKKLYDAGLISLITVSLEVIEPQTVLMWSIDIVAVASKNFVVVTAAIATDLIVFLITWRLIQQVLLDCLHSNRSSE